MSKRILVTPRSLSNGESAAVNLLVEHGFEPLFPSPGRQPTWAELAGALPEVCGWIAGVEPVDASLLQLARPGLVIARNGAGTDSIDTEAAAALDIEVIPARGANAQGVAELAFGLLIMGLRSAPELSRALGEERWEHRVGSELSGRTLGVVGFGAIGRILSSLAQRCGVSVVTYDPFISEASAVKAGARLTSLDELLMVSDAISLHVPPQPDGPLLNSKTLALLRPGAIVLNTARASLVDPNAMLAALQSDMVSFYAVDAFETEPPARSELLDHPRVFATPHIGAATSESIERASMAAATNLLEALNVQ